MGLSYLHRRCILIIIIHVGCPLKQDSVCLTSKIKICDEVRIKHTPIVHMIIKCIHAISNQTEE